MICRECKAVIVTDGRLHEQTVACSRCGTVYLVTVTRVGQVKPKDQQEGCCADKP